MTLAEKKKMFFQTITSTAPGMDDQETPTGEILKIHLLTEVIMEHLILAVFGEEHGKAIISLELTYSKKLILCSGCKLDCGRGLLSSDVIGSLKKLNSLRNSFAHKLGKSLSDEEVENLFVGQLGKDRDSSQKNIPLFNKLIMYKTRIHCHMLDFDPANV